jgi:hypothetical protein
MVIDAKSFCERLQHFRSISRLSTFGSHLIGAERFSFRMLYVWRDCLEVVRDKRDAAGNAHLYLVDIF